MNFTKKIKEILIVVSVLFCFQNQAEAQTSMVIDINPGTNSSSINHLTNHNGFYSLAQYLRFMELKFGKAMELNRVLQ
jgi:hypothetical protein